jgi:hypothetical protein
VLDLAVVGVFTNNNHDCFCLLYQAVVSEHWVLVKTPTPAKNNAENMGVILRMKVFA